MSKRDLKNGRLLYLNVKVLMRDHDMHMTFKNNHSIIVD